MIQIIEKSMKKWYYILVKNKLYRLEKKMIDKEKIDIYNIETTSVKC